MGFFRSCIGLFRQPFGFINLRLQLRCRAAWNKMDVIPAESVRGMTELDKARFHRELSVPCARIQCLNAGPALKILKKYLLKIEKLKPVREGKDDGREVLLDPKLFGSYEDLSGEEKDGLERLGIVRECFSEARVDLTYENFRVEDVFRAVLPGEQEGCTSYSRIGHIIHLNLRDHLLPYKLLIGRVLLDKLHGVKTVVNKSHVIDSTFRNFQMEVLAGEPDFVAEVRENMCTFRFDFSKVYWNPRLCTEHERIVKLLPEGAALFDVFAGVGPFSVPAAKVRRCRVWANDLNPHSFEWLKENVRINKVESIRVFNKDGRQFIREDLRDFLLGRPKEAVHVTMNLPALAVEFLDAFPALLNEAAAPGDGPDLTVHVYGFFEEAGASEAMQSRVERILDCSLANQIIQVIDVRDVAPKKHMLRMSFRMPPAVLLAADPSLDSAPDSKKLKLDQQPV